MKNFKLSIILFYLFLIGSLSHAQITDQPTRFEISASVIHAQGQTELKVGSGFWIKPRLAAQLWIQSRHGKFPYSTPDNLGIINGDLYDLRMRTNNTVGLNFRAYQKPKHGFFGGLGITRQKYGIDATTEFEGYFGFFGYSPNLSRKETSDIAWGINWQFGIAYPLKRARFEFLLGQNYLFMKGRQYEYLIEDDSTVTRSRSVRSDFALFPLSFEISYVINLF